MEPRETFRIPAASSVFLNSGLLRLTAEKDQIPLYFASLLGLHYIATALLEEGDNPNLAGLGGKI